MPFEERFIQKTCIIDKLEYSKIGHFLPFDYPYETEEEVGYGDQQVGQRQVVGELREVNGLYLVVTIEEVGLLQKAL
jgi:hypothetical protein